MDTTRLAIPDVVLVEPKVFRDDRGHFFESFNAERFSEAIGRDIHFVQDNESFSVQAVLRGLHYQVVKPQGKLVRVVQGEIFDVAVDIRKSSPTFGKWVGATLSSDNKHQLWVPEGFAHGFYVLSETAQVQYKVTDYRWAEHERCIRFDDHELDINWQPTKDHSSVKPPILSEKDRQGSTLKEADLFK